MRNEDSPPLSSLKAMVEMRNEKFYKEKILRNEDSPPLFNTIQLAGSQCYATAVTSTEKYTNIIVFFLYTWIISSGCAWCTLHYPAAPPTQYWSALSNSSHPILSPLPHLGAMAKSKIEKIDRTFLNRTYSTNNHFCAFNCALLFTSSSGETKKKNLKSFKSFLEL